jgi:hypothetical protein
LKLSWTSKDLAEGGLNRIKRLLSTISIGRSELPHEMTISIGQNIYNPNDQETRELIEEDRPYAGWAYVSAALNNHDADRLDSFEISLGMVGPSSQAENAQKIIHLWTSNGAPKGWDNQIKDEPGVVLSWQRFWRAVRKPIGEDVHFDFIPRAGVTLGNIMTYVNTGGVFRIGYNLPVDFGTSLIGPAGGTPAPTRTAGPMSNPSRQAGVSVFAGFDGRGIARNIFLDGNTWRDSHSVDKKFFVADLYAGISFIYHRVNLSYTHVLRTKEFERQEKNQVFGSLSITWAF